MSEVGTNKERNDPPDKPHLLEDDGNIRKKKKDNSTDEMDDMEADEENEWRLIQNRNRDQQRKRDRERNYETRRDLTSQCMASNIATNEESPELLLTSHSPDLTPGQANVNPVVRVHMTGESKDGETKNFKDDRQLFKAINDSTFQKKIKQDTLTVINDKTIRFEINDLEGIDLSTITELGPWTVKCQRPLSDINRDCKYGIIRGVNIEES